MKNIISMLLILLLSISLIGCKGQKPGSVDKAVSPSPSQPAKSPESPLPAEGVQTNATPSEAGNKTNEFKLVRKTDKTKYILSNGIEIKYPEKSVSTVQGNFQIPFIQISGLKDKALEERLNKTIETDLEKEVKVYTTELVARPADLHFSVDLNANNLLSISLRDFYSNPRYGFLYRLTDGKRLFLKDIFTSGTEYVPLINQKVVENLLSGERPEEDILREPFSTINPDQNFSLSQSELYIIFHKNESGFAERSSVSIPLSSIDDYVDVTDRYSGTERKNHEKTGLIVRSNNIFTTPKGEIINRANGKVWCYYPQISGLRDASFEEVINKTIKNSINEVISGKHLDGLTKTPNQERDCIAIIQLQVSFNHYGILSIRRYVFNGDESSMLQNLNTVYTFDLLKKKQIDPKNILKDYIAKNKELEDVFVRLVVEKLRDVNRNPIPSDISYSFIMEKSIIYFRKYYPEDITQIVIHFKENTFDAISNAVDCEVPLNSVANVAPEDFFGW